MSLSAINAAPMLKIIYGDNVDYKTMLLNKPLLASVEHRKDFFGSSVVVGLQYGTPQSRSHDPVESESGGTGGKYGNFTITGVSDYLTAQLDGVVVRKAVEGTDRTQFVNLLKNEMDGSLETFGQQESKELYGSQGGWRAQVHPTTAISTTALTLANPQSAILFAVGQKIQASQNAGGTLRATGGYVTLIAVNETTGVLTADGNWSTITSITNGDYLYVKGDAQNGGTAVSMLGLGDYCPVADPTPSENFLGMDRSVQPTQLAGRRFDGTGESMATVFIRAEQVAAFARGGGFSDATWFINPLNFGSLQIQYESSRFIDSDNEYGVGITTFRIGGKKVMPDPFCPVGYAFLVGKGAIHRATCGDQPGLNNKDSLEFRLVAGDKYQFQQVVDGNNICEKPWAIMRVALPAA